VGLDELDGGGGEAVWEWLSDSEGGGGGAGDGAGGLQWLPFTPEESERLEAAAAALQKTADVGRSYVDLVKMEQNPIDGGGGVRRVRRVVKRPTGEAAVTKPGELGGGRHLRAPSSAGERVLPGWGNFLEHVVSQVWCTYREGFSPVGPPIYTTDAGWGCMLRTAQVTENA
jgi:hypothetical protein